MSEKIDPREVLTYLNELGYSNITAHQLKEFIKDLKKIIKYDSRYGDAQDAVIGHSLFTQEENEYCECLGNGEKSNSSSDNSGSNKKNQTDNLQAPKYDYENQFKNSPNIQKEKHIAVHIYDTKKRKYIDHEHCIHLKSSDVTNNQSNQDKLNVGGFSASTKPETTESTIKSILPNSSREVASSRASKTSSKDRKSKVTFIRPAITKPTINKCDPVALYHYYQSEWKKTKFPGQDGRDDLRWAIREKMLSGPKVEVRSRCNIPRCGWSR